MHDQSTPLSRAFPFSHFSRTASGSRAGEEVLARVAARPAPAPLPLRAWRSHASLIRQKGEWESPEEPESEPCFPTLFCIQYYKVCARECAVIGRSFTTKRNTVLVDTGACRGPERAYLVAVESDEQDSMWG